MTGRAAALERIIQLFVSRWPDRFEDGAVTEHAPLGEDGLGLDSIDLVEFLLACEEAFDGPPVTELLERGPLDLGLVADHFTGPR